MGPIERYLVEDHRRLEALLERAVARPDAIDGAAYAEFRAGLLRHIGMEEKILLPTARRLRGGEPLPVARQMRLDHAALAALLVPTPTHEIVARIRALLVEHNPLEEAPGAMYQTIEALASGEASTLLQRLKDAPEVPVAPHFDGPRAFEAIDRLLRAAADGRAGVT